MNIISNACHGAHLYIKMNEQYNNPFMWSVLHYKDLKILCMNYENINFENIKVMPCERIKGACSILLDDKILIEYIHYLYHPDFTVPTKININIYFNEILKYTAYKYIERLNRMKQLNEEPVFLIMDMKDDFTQENTQDIINNTKYKTIIFTNKNYDIKNKSVKLIKSNLPDLYQYHYEPKDFIDNYYNEILRDL